MENGSRLFIYFFFFLIFFRSDLAYSVRRRGYKRIGEILGSTKETDLDGSNVEKVVSEDNYALGDSEDKVKRSICVSI